MTHSPQASNRLSLAAGFGLEQVAKEQVGPLNLHSGRDASAHPVKNALCAVDFKAQQAGDLSRPAKAFDQLGVRV